ncbi:MAG: transposase [Bacteroidota bacterium]|nr:transposase [Bacteroidota bacterium]
MKTNVLVVLDTRRPKPDGTYALLLRIIHGTTSSQITLGKFFHAKDWDDKARKVKSSYKGTESVMRLNNWISNKKTELVDFITYLDDKKLLATLNDAKQIKDLFERDTLSPSFTDYTQQLIDELKEAGRIGNARSYRSMLTHLRTITGKDDISFEEITYQFLKNMEIAHMKKGNALNGLAAYMRTIKAVYNQAIKSDLIEAASYPFKNYQIKTTKTAKRAISMTSIRKIQALNLSPQDPLYHTRLIFLFCFYTRGMPYADMARLKYSNIIGGRIYYERQKTDKPYSIKIIAEIKDILDIYLDGKNGNDYIFNIVKRTNEEEIYRDIEWARARYNEKLKDLAKRCEIAEKLTAYVARHTFATIAKQLNIPITSISEMLGHSSTKTTEIYLDSLPSEQLDTEHERVIKG